MDEPALRVTLTLALLGQKYHPLFVPARQPYNHQRGVNSHRNGTLWVFLQHEPGYTSNLANDRSTLEKNKVAVRDHIRDVCHDARLQVLDRNLSSRCVCVVHILTEQIHPPVLPDVKAHLQYSHVKVVYAGEDHVGQYPCCTQQHSCGGPITRDQQVIDCLLVLQVENDINQVNSEHDGEEVVCISKLSQQEHNYGLPSDRRDIEEGA
mmetsp:Transcript_16584/g.44457  ORF Transcript_16584/g.44457 Transcript_16584/m.44457 type:complete len:208 (+) Transcript_16584:1371-1994(+)